MFSIRKAIGDPHPLRPYVYAVLMLVSGLAGGYYYGRQKLEKVVVDHNIQVDHVVTQFKDRIVTITKVVQPDGTITETTKTEEKAGESVSDRKTEETHTESSESQSSYSLGVAYGVGYSSLLTDIAAPSVTRIEVQGGRRILGPIWGTFGVGLDRVTLGVRYDF